MDIDLKGRRQIMEQASKDRERISDAVYASNQPIKFQMEAGNGSRSIFEIHVEIQGITVMGCGSVNDNFVNGNLRLSDSMAMELCRKLKEIYNL